MSVYSRMLKLRIDPSSGEKLEVIFAAAMHLEDEGEIREFATEYSRMNPIDYKHDIQYVLSFYTIEHRKLWHNALKDFIFIDILYNRNEKELYRWQEYVNTKYKPLKKYANFSNEEKGQHQNILSQGPHKTI